MSLLTDPPVPDVRASATLYNTAARAVCPIVPGDPAQLTFYTCGPTVYDDAHIGNFRSFLLADLLRRWLQSPLCELRDPAGTPHRGPRRVVHVMNITDVGHMTDDDAADGAGLDKMAAAGQRLLEAKKAGTLPPGVAIDPRDPRSIAAYYAARFVEDARQLGLGVAIDAAHDPTLMPRATDAVPAMVAVIARLIAMGHAYAVGPAQRQVVYFAVQSFDRYGELSGNTLDQLRSGAGGRVHDDHQSGKRHPADFLLWKADPAHIMKWPSPWGEGYPGWHIECTVMALARLAGMDAHAYLPPGRGTIDLHSGGEDNRFPHHECENAQTCSLTGLPHFARHWVHVAHLFVEGAKMSKSKGNFFTARELFARGHEPAALRLALLTGHYRSNADFTLQGLTDAGRQVDRWRRFLADADAAGPASPGDPALRRDLATEFAAALADDLNTARAIAAINQLVSRTPAPGPHEAALLRAMDDVLHVLQLPRPARQHSELAAWLPGVAPDPWVEGKLAERVAAKKAKDFARADAIRAELATRGYTIKDVAGARVEVGRA